VPNTFLQLGAPAQRHQLPAQAVDLPAALAHQSRAVIVQQPNLQGVLVQKGGREVLDSLLSTARAIARASMRADLPISRSPRRDWPISRGASRITRWPAVISARSSGGERTVTGQSTPDDSCTESQPAASPRTLSTRTPPPGTPHPHTEAALDSADQALLCVDQGPAEPHSGCLLHDRHSRANAIEGPSAGLQHRPLCPGSANVP
jgi:hypothetical protein